MPGEFQAELTDKGIMKYRFKAWLLVFELLMRYGHRDAIWLKINCLWSSAFDNLFACEWWCCSGFLATSAHTMVFQIQFKVISNLKTFFQAPWNGIFMKKHEVLLKENVSCDFQKQLPSLNWKKIQIKFSAKPKVHLNSNRTVHYC